MGHRITALIGTPGTLAGLADRFGSPDPVALAFGLVALGLDGDRLDALALSSAAAFDGFTALTPPLSAALGRSLNEGPALSVETRYFGGRGGQGAALFEGGAMVAGDRDDAGPSAIADQPGTGAMGRVSTGRRGRLRQSGSRKGPLARASRFHPRSVTRGRGAAGGEAAGNPAARPALRAISPSGRARRPRPP